MRPRVIPVLLLDSAKRLIKTVQFDQPTYLGDPFNVIRIFNEKGVDEICMLDINASVEGRKPDLGFVSELASECFMPLSYGGGIDSVDVATPIFASGVEKVVLGRAAQNSRTVQELSGKFGAQAVAGCIDCKKVSGEWRVVVDRGRTLTSHKPVEYARMLEQNGIGELIVQNVDRDGLRGGYDTALIKEIATSVGVPVVPLGGAGGLAHLVEGLRAGGDAVASGSAFVFVGRLRAVLITYPTDEEYKAAGGPSER